MSELYPKVLIIGHTFDNYTGAGITLSNLFKTWPKECLANIIGNNKSVPELNYDICYNYYKLDKSDVSVIKPLNLFFKFQKGGIVNKPQFKKQASESKPKNKRKLLFQLIKKTFRLTGLLSIRFKYHLSDNLYNWIREYNPDIIYSALGDLHMIRLVSTIKKRTGEKLAIHMWDNWQHTLFEKYIFRSYWKRLFEQEYNRIIHLTDVFLCVSEAMKTEYSNLYGVNFQVIHNPVEPEKWENVSQASMPEENIVLYLGKINKDVIDSLILMSNIVEDLNKKNEKIVFKIYAPKSEKFHHYFRSFIHTILKKAIPYSMVPQIVAESSVLYLPLDFREESIRYTRFSMPTKSSDYMISGVPTLVFAHPEIALNIYTKETEWALLVESYDQNLLAKALERILFDEELRKRLSLKAIEIAKRDHLATTVRAKLRKYLTVSYGNQS